MVNSYEYEQETIDWLKSNWGISTEENDQNLQDVESGKLTNVWIGCDTDTHQCFAFCEENHGEKYKITTYSSIYCVVCHNALKHLKKFQVYVPKYQQIMYFVNKQEMLESMKKQEDEYISKMLEKRLKTEEKNAEILQEQGKRIFVSVELNSEYGSWRITGGQNGRLPYNTFLNAKNEMNQAFAQALPKEKTLLSSRPQPKKGKYFDLLTENFAFKIVSEIFEE